MSKRDTGLYLYPDIPWKEIVANPVRVGNWEKAKVKERI